MASLTTVNVAQNLDKKFQHKAARNLMDYLATFNCESQVVADSTNDLASTGTKLAMLNGQPIQLASAGAVLATALSETTQTAWATGVTATLGMIRWNGGLRYRCILAHTGRDGSDSDYINNEPGNSDNWSIYWEQQDHSAVSAHAGSIAANLDQWFLITQTADAYMQMWEAGDAAPAGTAECKVPLFDPKMYVPIAFLLLDNDAGSYEIGDEALSGHTTYLQITGPIFPHADNLDKN